jgi:hypothetical protein
MSSFSDLDEMWAVEFEVKNVIKFEGLKTEFPGSMEDFLEGARQHPSNWVRKT